MPTENTILEEENFSISRDGDRNFIVQIKPKTIDDDKVKTPIHEGVLKFIKDKKPEDGTRTVIISLSGVDYMNSSFYASLIHFHKALREKNDNKLIVTNLEPQILEAMSIMRLDKLFSIYKNIDDIENSPGKSAA